MAQQTQTKPLREVAEIISGFAFKSSEFSKHGILERRGICPYYYEEEWQEVDASAIVVT